MLAVFIVILVSAYIWLVPFLAERLAKRVPVSYEERLGDGIYNAIKPHLLLMQKKQLISMIFSES